MNSGPGAGELVTTVPASEPRRHRWSAETSSSRDLVAKVRLELTQLSETWHEQLHVTVTCCPLSLPTSVPKVVLSRGKIPQERHHAPPEAGREDCSVRA